MNAYKTLPFILLMLTFSCVRDKSVSPNFSYNIQDYFPISDNSSWIYKFYYINNRPLKSDEGTLIIDTCKVIDVQTKDDTAYSFKNFLEVNTRSYVIRSRFPDYIININIWKYIINENDSIIVQFIKDVSYIDEINVTTNPPIIFNDPIIDSTNKIIITHSEPFESYTEYQINIDINFYYNDKMENFSVSHLYRTTAPKASIVESKKMYLISTDFIKRYSCYNDDLSIELGLRSLDLLQIKTPIEIGNKWYFFTTDFFDTNGDLIEAEIMTISNIEVENTNYKDVLKISYSDQFHTIYYWYAKNVGIVQIQTLSYIQKLIEYH